MSKVGLQMEVVPVPCGDVFKERAEILGSNDMKIAGSSFYL